MVRASLRGPRVPAVGPARPARIPSPPAPAAAPTRGWAAAASPEALRVAFEYRGDVTLTLEDGGAVEGYVANLGERDLQLWRRGSTATLRIPREQVRRVALTGRDTASGRAFETWQSRQAARPAAS